MWFKQLEMLVNAEVARKAILSRDYVFVYFCTKYIFFVVCPPALNACAHVLGLEARSTRVGLTIVIYLQH